ncbi:MAG TPA: CocE/NonD family hydrolase [Actinomycetota bacterium]
MPAHRPAIRTTPRALVALLAFALTAAVAPSAQAQIIPCAEPTFVDGLSQNVFSASSVDWISSEGWVEAPFDTDDDGLLDRIHFDVTRPRETGDPTCNYKAPVIFEDSPYYAGLGPSRNWPVDHELGDPPADRTREPYFTAASTSPTISTRFESTWLPRGFAVVHAESPGTGLSDGCPTSGAPNESLAAKAVIDWLNGRATAYTTRTSTDEIVADWASGQVGMLGTSYNGTIPIGVASTGVEGLDAIVPISAISNWYDYYRANGMVRAPFTFQGEDLDVLVDAVYSRADEPAPQRTKCQFEITNIIGQIDRASGDSNPAWEIRNYMNDVDNIHAATLLAHGNNDFNVMTKHMDQLYRALKERGVPAMVYFHRGGHGGMPPDVMINRWFTRYLFDVQNDVESQPRAWVVRETNACPPRATVAVGDQTNTATLTVADTSKLTPGFTATIAYTTATGTASTTTRLISRVLDATHILLASAVATGPLERVADGQAVSLACNAGNPSPYADWPDPASAPVPVNLGAGAPGIGELTFREGSPVTETLIDNATVTAATSMNAATSSVRLVYKSPVLTRDVRISGTPWLDLRVAFSKPRANLTGVLIDYPATGNGTILTRGWLDPENRGGDPSVSEPVTPGESYRMRFDMQPKDSVIVAGRRIGIMVLSSDFEATILPAPGTELSLDLAASVAELPVVGGPAALAEAFGVTAPTVSAALTPAAPTGQNGWYTGDVSLSWQVDDGGAAATKDGCGDETFDADGELTRTCTATNAAGSSGPVSETVRRDATPPVTEAVTSPAAPDGDAGWYRTAPSITLAADDPTSGAGGTEYRLDGAPDWSPYTGPIEMTGDGTHTLEYRSTDVAGNVEAPRSLELKVDTTAPSIDITSPTDGASYPRGSDVTASYSCDDAPSGVASCAGPVADGAAIDTSAAGPASFTVEARDAAGNVRTRTVSYSVAYLFEGFFRPVENPPVLNRVSAGKSIPLKFSLGGNAGLGILAEGSPRSSEIACDPGAPDSEVESTTTSKSGLTYDKKSDQYTYVWKTAKSWTNTCRRFVLELTDGSTHTALFRFTK